MKELYPTSRTHNAISSPGAVTDADIAAYRRTGFLAVGNMLSADEIAAARTELDALLSEQIAGANLAPEPSQRAQFESAAPGERAHLVRKLMGFVGCAPRLREISEHRAIRKIVERLAGEKVRMIQDMALVKPAHIGSEKPWHQDLAYFDWHPADKVLGVWIALDAATVENGCMFVLPGSQADGPVAHIHLRDCQIPDERVAADGCVAVPLQPGAHSSSTRCCITAPRPTIRPRAAAPCNSTTPESPAPSAPSANTPPTSSKATSTPDAERGRQWRLPTCGRPRKQSARVQHNAL